MLIVNAGSYISYIAMALAGLLYFFPGIATTPSNKTDPENPTYKGIPLDTIEKSIYKIENDPLNPVVLFFESYILVLDFCHGLAYLYDYMKQYLEFDQPNFPSVSYANRGGKELSNDLWVLVNAIGVWKFVGAPLSGLTVVVAPVVVILYTLQASLVLDGGN